MITRMWRGWTTAADADAYEEFLTADLFVSMGDLEGFLGAEVLRRDDGPDVAFVVLTRFASLDDIRRFAGDDLELARIEPRAAELLAHHDARATHFTVSATTDPHGVTARW